MKYTIYQLKDIRNTMYSFVGWSDAVAKDFDINDYKKVYEGDYQTELEDRYNHVSTYAGAVLNKLFEMFNINHPADFRGHSLSVSDLVALKKDDSWIWYYCDSFGWKEITDIMPEEYVNDCVKRKGGNYMGITFTLTENAVKDLIATYADHKRQCMQFEEEVDYDEYELENDIDYQFNMAYCHAAEEWMRAIGISQDSYFVQNIIHKEGE